MCGPDEYEMRIWMRLHEEKRNAEGKMPHHNSPQEERFRVAQNQSSVLIHRRNSSFGKTELGFRI
jgi:hypothetical protein